MRDVRMEAENLRKGLRRKQESNERRLNEAKESVNWIKVGNYSPQ